MSIKMAKKDMLMQFNLGEYELYSNQFIPLITNADMLDRLRLQGIFDKHFSGGSICHLNVENRVEDAQHMEDLIVASAKMGVIYFAINYNLQRCENGHMTVANIHNTICPICGAKITDNYTRVVGFLTNSKNWHKVRRTKDRPNRVFYEGIASAKLVKKSTKKANAKA